MDTVASPGIVSAALAAPIINRSRLPADDGLLEILRDLIAGAQFHRDERLFVVLEGGAVCHQIIGSLIYGQQPVLARTQTSDGVLPAGNGDRLRKHTVSGIVQLRQ